MSVYEGNQPYIFISYSHKDSKQVLSIIQALQARGFRVWYDEGIEAGTEWPANIEQHLERAAVVIAFLSNNSIESVNCRNEINVAADLKKEMLVAQLEEEVVYKYGMRLQLSSKQKIFCSRHNSVAGFVDELEKIKMLESCKGPCEGSAFATKIEMPITETKKTNKAGLFIGIGAGAVVLLLALVILFDSPQPPSSGDIDSQTTPIPTIQNGGNDTKLVLSDNLLDFTFELEGVVYQLPCSYEKFTQNGWASSSNGYSADTLLGGNSWDVFTLSKDGENISVFVYNYSGNAKKLSDCKIGGIQVEFYYDVDFKLAKGITAANTSEEIKEAFGIPTEHNKTDTSEKLLYSVGNSDFNCVEIFLYTDGTSADIELRNFVKGPEDETETNVTKPEYLSTYQVPAELGTDILSAIVSVEGTLYQLPAPVSCFVEAGWEITSQPGAVVAGGTDSVTLKKDGKSISLSIINFAEYQTTPENCVAYKLSVYAEDGISVLLPGITKPLAFGMAQAEVEANLPEALKKYESTYSDSYGYLEYKERDFSVDVYVDAESKQLSRFNISCKTWEIE